MPNLFTTKNLGDIVTHDVDWNGNFSLIESTYLDQGPLIISGLTLSAGAGLIAAVAAGVAVIGAEVSSAGLNITGLTNGATNHLWLLQNGTGFHNTTGTAPANSVKLGTAVTAGGVVTSVNIQHSSGRQQLVALKDAVLGGPNAGASAGHPASANLASWAAAAADGTSFYGTLPSGAVPATPTSLASLTDVSLSGVAQGDVLFRGASTWNNLAHGTAGQVLTSGGAAANPTWGSAPSPAPDLILSRAGAATPADPRYLTITPGADTALTASTEANDVLWSLNRTQQFATGALTNQRAVWIRKPTYGFVGASTITNAATVAIEDAPAAGTNAILTNPYALWVQNGGVQLGAGGVAGLLAVCRPTVATGSPPPLLTVCNVNDTGLTASTENVEVNFALQGVRQFATGALTTQRAVLVQAPTYAFVGASTITNAATLAITGAPVAGTNATLTNAWPLWVQAGTSRFDGPVTCPGAGSNSERFGAGAAAAGNGSTVLGNGASGAGVNSVVIGQGAAASATGTVAIGDGATANFTNATAVGASSSAGAASSVAIGPVAATTGANSVAIGQSATAAIGGFALGGGATAASTSIAIGISAAASSQSISLGQAAIGTAINQLVVGSNQHAINDGYLGRGVTDSSPASLTLQTTGGSGTNVAGASFTLAGGKSTGSAAGGSLNFATSPAGGTGTGLNALTTWLSLSSAGLLTLTDAVNIAAGTTTGTKIGTLGGASGQKLSFWNQAPIVQPLLATGAAHTVDDVITTLQNLGLCRQT